MQIEEEQVEASEQNNFIDNSESLIKNKHINNEFNAEENVAETQYFIQNYNCYVPNNETMLPKEADDKSYDLACLEDCIEFVKRYNNSEYFTTALVLCVLQTVPLADLYELRTIFQECLQQEMSSGEEEHRETERYVALNSILTTIGARSFVSKNGMRCVTIGKSAEKAMLHFFEQYIVLQRVIPLFMVRISSENKFSTAPYIYQTAESLSKISSLKIKNFRTEILPLFYEDTINPNLFSVLMYKLYLAGDRKTVENIISEWFSLRKVFFLRILCLTYAVFEENEIECFFEMELTQLLSDKMIYLHGKERRFLAGILMRSENFRTLFSGIFSELFAEKINRDKKRTIAQAYINIIENCYYRVSEVFVDLPLVVCDTQKQQKQLGQLLDFIMTVYELRKQLYAILEAYLKEISQYELTEKSINHLSGYIYNLSLSGKEYQEDLFGFLAGCRCVAVEKIRRRLLKAYEKM